jgi:hypothetical protein
MKEGRTVRRLTLGVLVVSCFALTMGPAFAKGPGGGHNQTLDSSIVLDQTDPHLGGNTTFTVTYPNGTKDPRVQVTCYQDGLVVYGEAGASDFVFMLGGSMSLWLMQGGPASCTAELYNLTWNGNQMQKVVWLASAAFDATG